MTLCTLNRNLTQINKELMGGTSTYIWNKSVAILFLNNSALSSYIDNSFVHSIRACLSMPVKALRI